MSEREKVLSSLKPLFEKAESEGLWFHCHYQDLWFSPEQLREYHDNGKFLWGAVNWELADPDEKVTALTNAAARKQKEAEDFHAEVMRWKVDHGFA